MFSSSENIRSTSSVYHLSLSMRHFPEMTRHSSRNDVCRPKSLPPKVENLWWYDIAQLTGACGYEDVRRPYGISQQAKIEMAKAFLDVIRPAPYKFLKEESDRIANDIIQSLNRYENLFKGASELLRNHGEGDILY